MISLVVHGAAGRMGQAVLGLAAVDPGVRIKACVDRAENVEGRGEGWASRLDSALAFGDVVVDFTTPPAAVTAARLCAARGAALVSGTTGLAPADEQAFAEAAARCAVLRASNFSLGVAVLRRALRAALAAAPADWDVEIVERHHRRKVDSPSGTALTLAGDVTGARGGAALRFGREGAAGPRPAGEVGIHAVRGGSWVGDHTVLLSGEGECIELRHVASDRAAFAAGALAAAKCVAGRAPGLYTLDDCLAGRNATS